MTTASPDRFAPWLARAEDSDYFSAPDAAADVAAYLDDTRVSAATIGRANPSADRVLLVGSGGSLACLHTAAYLLQSLSGRVVEVVPALELRWRAPRHLGPGTLVVLNSWSGKNSDVLDALAVAEERGATTVAIVGKAGSPLAARCDDVIVYAGAAIYEVPILAVIDLVLAADGEPVTLDAWQTAAAELPAALEAAHARGPAVSEQVTDTLGGTQHLLITGAGPFSSLALKLANVVMENDRLSAAYYDAVELRHGAVEVFDRTRPDVLVLAGSDASRPLTDRVIAFCAGNGARVGVCDGSGYGLSSPLLEPLVANVLTQWVVIRLAWARGIDDLDERVYMGGGSLSDGQWP